MKTELNTIEAFVLRDCGFGLAGEVVILTMHDAQIGAAHGMLDLNQDAVKNAKGEKVAVYVDAPTIEKPKIEPEKVHKTLRRKDK